MCCKINCVNILSITLFENDLKKRCQDFILSELLLAVMEEDHLSIRKLAKEAGVSPSLIQDLRSGKKDNLTFKSFSHIVEALGYDIVLEKRIKGLTYQNLE